MHKVIHSFLIFLPLIPKVHLSLAFAPLFQTSFTNIDMDRRSGRNNSRQSQDRPVGRNTDILRVIQNMVENQQRQTELLRQGLITAPQERRPGNVSDFRRLQPAIFTGGERPLDAEQWLIDTTDLLKAARVPEEDQVEVAKLSLIHIWRCRRSTLCRSRWSPYH